MRREEGFTLIEVLTAIVIAAILMTLVATALRGYWLTRSLHDGAEEIVTGLRHLQERSVSDSHPLVYGAWFKVGSSDWGSVRFDPKDPSVSTDDQCVSVGAHTLPGGVEVESVSFSDVSPQTSTCAAAVPAGSEVAFFFARGTATGGTIRLLQPAKSTTEDLTVSSLTGRVERQ